MMDTEPEFFLLGEQPQGRRAWKKRKIQRGADTNTEEEEECERGKELPFYTFHFSLFAARWRKRILGNCDPRCHLHLILHFTFYPSLKCDSLTDAMEDDDTYAISATYCTT